MTFFAYAGLHCLREGWSYSKTQLQKEFDIPAFKIGLIDTLYLFSYSLGMATIGNLGSRIGLKYFVSVGMIIATISYMSFSLFYAFWGVFIYALMAVFMCINGFFQSTGWPGVVGIIGNWFGKGKRGLLMGFWAVNANVGNIIALIMLNILDQTEHLNWTYNFIFTGLFTLLIAFLCMKFLQEKPR